MMGREKKRGKEREKRGTEGGISVPLRLSPGYAIVCISDFCFSLWLQVTKLKSSCFCRTGVKNHC